MQKNIKISFLIFIGIFLYTIGYGSGYNNSKESSNCKSVITINGTSNVNKFQFHNDDPIITTASTENYYDNQIRIPVNEFEASNLRMLQDFHKMVRASEYPYINIEIESMALADFDETSGMTNFRTKVSIAGKTNTYTVASEIAGCEHEGFILKGNLEVKLTDFDIEPPTKVFGAVKVNDEVLINFAFRLQHEESVAAITQFNH